MDFRQLGTATSCTHEFPHAVPPVDSPQRFASPAEKRPKPVNREIRSRVKRKSGESLTAPWRWRRCQTNGRNGTPPSRHKRELLIFERSSFAIIYLRLRKRFEANLAVLVSPPAGAGARLSYRLRLHNRSEASIVVLEKLLQRRVLCLRLGVPTPRARISRITAHNAHLLQSREHAS